MEWLDDPAAHRAQKRRRLSQYALQEQHQHQYANYIGVEGDHEESQLADLEYVSAIQSDSRNNFYGETTAKAPQEGEASECCYGMLYGFPVVHRSASNVLPTVSNHIPVFFELPNRLHSENDGNSRVFDIAEQDTARILSEFNAVPEISIQLYCYAKSESPRVGRSKTTGRQRTRLAQWFLNIIVYGSIGLKETIGNFLSSYGKYLQDPLGCDRRVLYQNPHIMSSGMKEIVMTDNFLSPLLNIEVERLNVGPDLLAQLMENETSLEETEAPSSVLANLFPHQKQALTFMLRRERGWNMDHDSRDIWTREKDASGRVVYRNNVNGVYQYEPPQKCLGGLLADDMGLGKTLSMICLIAANQATQLPSPPITPEPIERISSKIVKTTLLVVPPPLIQAWEKQFRLHLRPGALNIHVFHGQNRKGIESMDQYDVVITTFHTVSSIWRKDIDPQNNPESLFSLIWHRVILDEAHIIQNSQSQLARACGALCSERRWAITGTPIQNKLTDFASIVKFLGVHPYSEQSIYEEEISRPWHRGHPEGYLRLKTLVKAITISRTKTVVILPSRSDEIHHLEFSSAEREVYEAAKRHTITLLVDAISSRSQPSKSFNALQRLNALRLICCHGVLARANQAVGDISPAQNFVEAWNYSESEALFHGQLLDHSATCPQCGNNLLEEFLEGSTDDGLYTRQRIFKSGSMFCERCRSQVDSVSLAQIRRQDRKHILDDIPNTPPVRDEEDVDMASIDSMPTKIRALGADILAHYLVEKSVVFSFWTYTLDLIQVMLNDYGIEYTRIDGKTPLHKRNEALRSFHSNKSLRVILVSITCGGAGLDLTAASRVYLLEPHWNPMIEEQALCRVHRVGQERSVTTIRYLIKDSFEEQVVEIQKRKRMLAQVTFGQGPLSEDGIGLGTLQYLKSVLE